MNPFLPVNRQDMVERSLTALDFICVTGDAYVDHPTFGIAIISRVIESYGHTVGVIAQPVTDADFEALGRPRCAFFVTSGNVDSMVAHYTAAKKKRSDDPYTPGNKAGRRPDRAVDAYCRRLRALYPDVPIITGGMEASLRRFAHYDYWADAVLPSSLVSSGADLLVYGMGEHQTQEITHRLAQGEPVAALTDIRGTCYVSDTAPVIKDAVSIASFEKTRDDKDAYLRAFKLQYDEQDAVHGRAVIQKHGAQFVVQNPPALPLERAELDRVYDLPYAREPHPMYDAQGGVKAIEEVRFSIGHNRGCFGNCAFCSIASHQGRQVTSRSIDNVVREAERFTQHPEWKGLISDVGGPTANFRHRSCGKQVQDGMCRDKRCLDGQPCVHLRVDHREYVELLRQLRAIPGVRRVFVRSGLRHDYMLLDRDSPIIDDLTTHHVSGQLRLAPEHAVDRVLALMGKPPIGRYDEFVRRFDDISHRIGKDQYVVPYLISSHPGATLADAVELALYLKRHRIRPEQVQDFYPTPGTVSTCMYYTGKDPFTGKNVYVAKTPHDKAMQRALLQYYEPKNRALVREALVKAGRADLIGSHRDALVPGTAPSAGHNREARGGKQPDNRRGKRDGTPRGGRGRRPR